MRLEVSLDQPTESLSDFSNTDLILDQFSDSVERFWVREASPTSSIAKEYDKWPRILFRLESSNAQGKIEENNNDFKPHLLNGFAGKCTCIDKHCSNDNIRNLSSL